MSNYNTNQKLISAFAMCMLFCSQTLTSQSAYLYGMAPNGGTDSLGAIFRLDPATNTETLLYSFSRDSDGQAPWGDLVYCPLNGLLYGLTPGGGVYDGGAVITFDPATNTEKRVWSFGHGTSAASPYGDLVYDATNQLFYGMSFGGGRNGTGTVFSLNPATDSARVLWNWGYSPGASLPYGNLVLNPNNNLYYGLTQSGGNYNDGAIITLNPATDTVHRVYNFNDAPGGEIPYASLVWYAPNNLFYGVTTQGGTDSLGVIFSFNPADSIETPLYNFGFGSDAASPQGNLIFDQGKGLFYGLAINGGTNGTGAIFSFDPGNNSEAVVYNFGSVLHDGEYPNGSLTYNAANQLYYGTTQSGGTHVGGTIFSFNAGNNTETTVWSFGNGFDAANPVGNLLLFGGNTSGIHPVANNYGICLYPNPGKGNFTLLSQHTVGSAYQIYNTNGDIMASGMVETDHQNISLPEAAEGMYVLMLAGKDGTVPVRFAVVR